MRHPKSGRIKRSPGAVARMMKIDWRTFSSSVELEMPPFRLSETGKRKPLPRKERSLMKHPIGVRASSGAWSGAFYLAADRWRSRRELALDKLLALATGDTGREIHFLDGQRPLPTERARSFSRAPRSDHIQHILPSHQRFLIHAMSFRFAPFKAQEILGMGLVAVNAATKKTMESPRSSRMPLYKVAHQT